MQINPEFERFSQVEELEKLREVINEGDVIAEGKKEHLEKLQADLRRAGYKKQEIPINFKRLQP